MLTILPCGDHNVKVMWLSDLLKTLRTRNALTQADMAEAMKTSQTTVRQLEMRNNGPTLRTIVRAAGRLDYDVVLVSDRDSFVLSERKDANKEALWVEPYENPNRQPELTRLLAQLSPEDVMAAVRMLQGLVRGHETESRQSTQKKRRVG